MDRFLLVKSALSKPMEHLSRSTIFFREQAELNRQAERRELSIQTMETYLATHGRLREELAQANTRLRDAVTEAQESIQSAKQTLAAFQRLSTRM